jgi:uncharacterized protein YpmS
MKNYKMFFFGFIAASIISVVILAIFYANWAHAALLSRIDSQIISIQIANQQGGGEKLKQLVSLTLVSDYCATKSLGEYFFIGENKEELDTLKNIRSYMVAEDFTILCEK